MFWRALLIIGYICLFFFLNFVNLFCCFGCDCLVSLLNFVKKTEESIKLLASGSLLATLQQVTKWLQAHINISSSYSSPSSSCKNVNIFIKPNSCKDRLHVLAKQETYKDDLKFF